MYGCNKLYCEQLGRYYALHYKQLAANTAARRVDFRSVRFPGLISATTMPAGGTSDYASEMIHAAARGERYACFVRPDTRIPFMAMPDAVDALLALAHAPRERLTKTAYNLAAFSPSAAEIREIVLKAFPAAAIDYDVDVKRQAIVDSWPTDVDDSAARADWRFIRRRSGPRVQRLPDRQSGGAVRKSRGYNTCHDRPCRRVAPATVSNVACGFDVLGFPMEEPGDCVTVRFTEPPGHLWSRSMRSSATEDVCRARPIATRPASPRGRARGGSDGARWP
jgi:hypothetical protein